MRESNGSWRRALVIGAAGAAACLGAPAGAQDDPDLTRFGDRTLPDTRTPLPELVERLDDELFAVRERAMSDLAGRDDLTLEQIEALLADATLTPEQRLRLSRVALAVFMRGPRAAMGIRFSNMDDSQPARILEPQPGFDALRVLRPGDQILEADGIPIIEQGTLRWLILSHSPGDRMPLTIRRDGEEIETELTLGSFAQLERAGTPRPIDLLGAWRMRRSRGDGAEGPEVIEPRAQEIGAGAPERDSPLWREVFATGDAPDSLVVGGQARQGADLSLAELAAGDEARTRAAADLGPELGDLERQIVWFRQQRATMAEDLTSLEVRLARADVNAIERQVLERDIAARRESLRRIDQQIQALEMAIRAGNPRR